MGPRCPGFPLKKKDMALKCFILPEKHFKARGGDSERGEGGLIKVKKQVDLKINFR